MLVLGDFEGEALLHSKATKLEANKDLIVYIVVHLVVYFPFIIFIFGYKEISCNKFFRLQKVSNKKKSIVELLLEARS